MDSKQSLNLGGSNGSFSASIENSKNRVYELANSIKEKVGGALDSVTKKAEDLLKKVDSAGKPVSSTTNKVAENGAPSGYSPTSSGLLIPSNRIADSGGEGGGRGIPPSIGMGSFFEGDALKLARRMSGAAGQMAGGITQALPSANQYISQDFLTNRMRFYSTGLNNNDINNMQNQLNRMGTMKPGDLLDAAKALNTAVAMGLGGAPNLMQFMGGAAQASNITPGVGIARSVQAAGAMQQPRTVNMLMGGMGIAIRGADGSMKSVPQVVNEIWSRLNAQKRGTSPITKRDIMLAMEPGNSLDSMLNMYFGNDEVLRKQVADGLIVKAEFGGANLETISRQQLQDAGVSTVAVNSIANRNARASRVLQQTAGSAAAGAAVSNTIAADLSTIANALTPIADALAFQNGLRSTNSGIGGGGFKSFMQGLFSIGGGLIGGIALGGGIPGALLGSQLGGAAANGMFRAAGGDVSGKAPYIVGEKGPELFVPKSDGVIIPNNLLGNPFREDGKGVKAGGMDVTQRASDIVDFLMKHGQFTKKAAEGVVGNLVAESGLRTAVATGDGGTSFGLAQWHLGRKDRLFKFAESRNLSPSSLLAQEQFLLAELKNKQYSDLMTLLKDKNTTREQAATAFMTQFERPDLRGKDPSKVGAYRAGRYSPNLVVKEPSDIMYPSYPSPSLMASGSTTTDTKGGGGSGGTSVLDNKVSPSPGDATTLRQLLSLSNPASAASLFKGTQIGSSYGTSGHTYNYGGVNITISGAQQTPESIARAIKDMLKDPALHLGGS